MSGPSLAREASAAMRWNAVSGGATLLSQFLQLAVLARLLPPGEFGLAATAISLMGLWQGLADLGLPYALVQKEKVEDATWSSALWAVTLGGAFFALLFAGLAPAAQTLLHLPELAPLLCAAALAVPWSGPAAIYQARLQRRLDFAVLGRVEIAAAAASLTAALAYCAWKQEAMALLAGQIALSATRCIGFGWFASLPFRARPAFGNLRPFFSFASYQTGQHALTYIMGNLDRLLVARLLGATAAGYYAVASQIALRPLALLGPFAIRTLFPLLSRLQDDVERLRSSFVRSLSLLGLLAGGIYALLFGLSDPLLRLALGPGWEPALPALRVLAVLGFLWVMLNPVGSLTLALGKAGTGFWLNLLMLVANAAAVLIGSRHGILGAALGMLTASVLLLPLDFILLRRWIGLSPVKLLSDAGWPMVPAVLTAVALTLAASWARGLPLWLELAQGLAAGCAAYVALAWAFRGGRLKESIAELLRKLRGD